MGRMREMCIIIGETRVRTAWCNIIENARLIHHLNMRYVYHHVQCSINFQEFPYCQGCNTHKCAYHQLICISLVHITLRNAQPILPLSAGTCLGNVYLMDKQQQFFPSTKEN